MDLANPMTMGLATRMPSVAILSAYEASGGAARAALRLHESLCEMGVNSKMMVQFEDGRRPGVDFPSGRLANVMARARHHLDLLPARMSGGAVENWASGFVPNRASTRVNRIAPDIVHLHGVWKGFVPIQSLPRIKSKIVWTLHDMWPFTGGCTYDAGCGRFREHCGRCPVLQSSRSFDWSRLGLWMRSHYWRALDMTIVTPSRWLADEARSSRVFSDKRVEVIANPLNLDVYAPLDKTEARRALRLPPEKRIALFASVSPMSDKRKGFDLLRDALARLRALWPEGNLMLCIAGAWQNQSFSGLGESVHSLGVMQDDISMALAYSAADVFLAPSRQENLANTVAESLACGTPCVAFRIGGMVDMIDHEKNGYLAAPFDIDDFALGIRSVVESRERHGQMSAAARSSAQAKLDSRRQTAAYLRLYRSLVGDRVT